MNDFLDRLLDGSRRRVDEARARTSLEDLRAAAEAQPAPPSFHAGLARAGVSVIAEIKRASPSKGELAPGISAVAQAQQYVAGQVDAISVLTEPEQFRGTLQDLAAVAELGTPTIRKDFIVEEYQIWEARLAGAAAILLIVAALDDERLAQLHGVAAAAGLDVLVEVHDEAESRRAARLEPAIVGVNARNLRTFEVDRQAFERLRPLLPAGALAVAESGIRGPEDVRSVAAHGADAVLVGETLVKASDPMAMAASLVAAGRESVPMSATLPTSGTDDPAGE